MTSAIDTRPSLILQTVYFHDSERVDAERLGIRLYDQLTRPIEDPLGQGAGIPVFVAVEPDRVDRRAADMVVVIPVLGTLAFQLRREATVKQISKWHKELDTGLVLPLPIDEVWRGIENRFPGKPLLTELFEADVEDEYRITIDEIVHSVARLLADNENAGLPKDKKRRPPTLFVSHAKQDLNATGRAAKLIADYTKINTTGQAFFDRTELASGESLQEQIEAALGSGVFIAVRGDSYSSRNWCQQELLLAKQNGLPALTVEILQQGETRSSAYGGNTPTMVWTGDPSQIVSRAMVEWVRAAHFRAEAERIAEVAELPDQKVLIRPPELLDLAQGPLGPTDTLLVMHPDPELPVQERQVLRSVNPRIRLVTPLSAYRRVLSRDPAATHEVPLEGLQIAMSLSDSPDVNGPDGYTKHHIVDITTQLARALISTGASIAYGGDFRHSAMSDPHKQGFTILLAELIRAHNQTADGEDKFLHSYLGLPISLGTIPKNLPMTLHHMSESEDMSELSIITEKPDDDEAHRKALCYSDMRRVMAEKTNARIIIGGNAEPRLPNKSGYGGRYSGIVEEAWRSLQQQQPVYVIGGYGGGAALVAELLDHGGIRPIPQRMQDATWCQHDEFQQRADLIDHDEDRKRLGLPRSMDDLAQAVKDLGLPLLQAEWNGLSIEENEQLFWSRDPLVITRLVMKGLLKVNRKAGEGRLAIELVHGSITAASELDAIALGTFKEIPLAGAGAAVDDLLGGLATAERSKGRSLVNVSSRSEIDAGWIYLASLGKIHEAGNLEEKIRDAAKQTAHELKKLGLKRLGIVAYGGNMISDVKAIVGAMLDGLTDLAGYASVSWFETSKERFGQLNTHLLDDDRVNVKTRRIAASATRTEREPAPLMIHIESTDGGLVVTLMPPSGNALVGKDRREVSAARVDQFAEGSGKHRRTTPDLETLESRGRELATVLLGQDAEKLLAWTAEANAKVIIVHDVPSSRLPFEAINSTAAGAPAAGAGLHRRLAISGASVNDLFTRPAKSSEFNLLLVINPVGDLDQATVEGDAVEAVLKHQKNIHLTVLREDEATKAAVLQALPSTDMLHYCGHAFFDGPGEQESGLWLAGHQKLTLADLRGVGMPRIAFVNACEAARVRGEDTTADAASFAEFFLRSGVEAFLGTFWRVGDSAAKTFSKEVYTHLATGKRLDEAVTAGRKKLKHEPNRDWANYILYGDGRFQLIR